MDDVNLRRSRGFRLIDLVTVLGILIILGGVLMVVVRKWQAASALSQCQNNLKQIVLAVHDYASAFGNALPPLSGAQIENGIAHPQAILLTLLPFVECDNIYRPAMREPRGQTWNGSVYGAPIFSSAFCKTYVCPADSSNSLTVPVAHGWVGSSYAANAQVFGNKALERIDPQSGQVVWNELESTYNIGNIPALPTNTIFITERFALAGVPGADSPCSWVDPPAGGPALGNKDFDALGCPLQTFTGRTGPIRASIGGPGIFYGSGTPEDPVGAEDGAWKYPLPELGIDPTLASTDGRAQSQHSAVIHVGMGDGSVRRVTTAISQLTWVRAIDAARYAPLSRDW
jgi:type II secretory pathway pseudopilin PulG